MIESNIPNLLGAGSGIDSKALVKQLVEIEKAPKQSQIDGKRESYQTTLSDLGVFKSALSTLNSSLAILANPDTYVGRSVSFPDSDVVIPNSIKPGAASGTYSIEVLETAQAHSLRSTTFSDVEAAVGKGTLTIRFGAWDTAVPPTAFSQNADIESLTVTIDDNNNSLEGLRDAINDAKGGVKASIVNDGSGFRLLLTANSGLKQQIDISVAEDDVSPTNGDNAGLSRFAFNESAQQLVQNQAGRDVELNLNGLYVTRSSNTITDLIDGFSFSIAKKSPGEVININITEDKAVAEQAIRDFVETFNTYLETIKPLTGYNEETDEYGSLARDGLVKSIINKVRAELTNPVPGVSGDLTALTNLGIRTQLDGTLSIKEADFSKAFENNFEDIKGIFSPETRSDSDKVKVTGYGPTTVPGTYSVKITQDPTKGVNTGTAIASFPVDTTGKDYSFIATIDGVTSSLITLPDGVTYNSGNELAAAIQSLVNSDSALVASKKKVQVSFDVDHLVFTSDAYGSKSNVTLSSAGADLAELGLANGAGVTGKNVAGTINGEAAFGVGDVLLPALGNDAYGLKLRIAPGAGDTEITYAKGVGASLGAIIEQFLSKQGAITTRQDGLKDDIKGLDDDQEKLDRRSDAYYERLQAQFIAMEALVDQLNSTRDYLKSALENLPFTAKNN